MKGFKHFLHHLFIPRESNNHRAKILHHSSLLVLMLLLVSLTSLLQIGERSSPDILGLSTNISVEELLFLTNQKRQEAGLPALKLDPVLSQAAAQKASDMFSKNYWAHNNPDGTTPWVFIRSVGYEYNYAGENLARGFTTSGDIINAWMESTGHRENMLSKNYEDIGFAIVEGNLTGDDTVLVVEMFGSRILTNVVQAPATTQPRKTLPSSETQSIMVDSEKIVATEQSKAPVSQNAPSSVAAIQTQPIIDTSSLTKTLSLGIIALLLFVLVMDIIIIERNKIVRIVAHNLDHIIFFIILFLIVLFIGKGAIL